MKAYVWNEAKNQLFKAKPDISFEEVIAHIAVGDLLGIVEHTNQEKYKDQHIFIVKMRDYTNLSLKWYLFSVILSGSEESHLHATSEILRYRSE